mmetsp:Transcript_24148/g.78676  ORF Transcript_24148/g.78676 Transcript_24148/m.78676 type:complete len:468 (+) Transcript_24148:2971-4374(+)
MLGQAYTGIGNVYDAEKYLQQVLQLTGDAQLEGERMRSFALSYKLWCHIGNGGGGCLPCRTIATPIKMEVCRVHQRLFELYFFGQKTSQALYSALSSVEISEAAGTHSETAIACANVSLAIFAYWPGSKWSRRYSQKALKIISTIRGPDNVAAKVWVRLAIGMRDFGMGKWRSCNENLRESMNLVERTGDLRRIEQVSATLAFALHLQGDLNESLELYRKVHASGYRRGDIQSQSWGLLGMARNALSRGLPGDSRQLLQTRKEMLQKYVGRTVLQSDVNASAHLATVQLVSGELASALHIVEAVLDTIEEQDVAPSMFTFTGYCNIASVFFHMLSEAVNSNAQKVVVVEFSEACQRVINAFKRFSKYYPIARARLHLYESMQLYFDGQESQAEAKMEKALAQARELDWVMEEAEIHFAMAEILPPCETRIARLEKVLDLYRSSGLEPGRLCQAAEELLATTLMDIAR